MIIWFLLMLLDSNLSKILNLYLFQIRLRTTIPQPNILTYEQVQEIREQIILRNENETILNEELFGPVQPDTVIIVVQVSKYLKTE